MDETDRDRLADADARAIAVVRAVRDDDMPGLRALVDDLMPPLPGPTSPHYVRFAALRQRISDALVALALLADERPDSDWLEERQRRVLGEP